MVSLFLFFFFNWLTSASALFPPFAQVSAYGRAAFLLLARACSQPLSSRNGRRTFVDDFVGLLLFPLAPSPSFRWLVSIP